MRTPTFFDICPCPDCGTLSNSVACYKARTLQHYALNKMETKTYEKVQLRCKNTACSRKRFTFYPPQAGLEELEGRSRYTKSSKFFVSNKMLKHQVSYSSLSVQLKEDFDSPTSISTLHTWTQKAKLVDNIGNLSKIEVLHTDEKHPSKKKRLSNKKFVIASAGKETKSSHSVALHANLADSNASEAIQAHYQEMIDKGLPAENVHLVVTDMLSAYSAVILKMFPNALHQFCIFHLIQSVNKALKEALKAHRIANYAKGERKEAHQTSLLMLKGEEKLSETERNKVEAFCLKHPEILPNYALKEDIRVLYATVQTPEQAYAYKDILEDTYATKIAEPMQKNWQFINENFENTIAYLRKDRPADKTNNDAERMMRAIKRTQQTHYFLRNEDCYIRKIRCVLGIQKPIAS